MPILREEELIEGSSNIREGNDSSQLGQLPGNRRVHEYQLYLINREQYSKPAAIVRLALFLTSFLSFLCCTTAVIPLIVLEVVYKQPPQGSSDYDATATINLLLVVFCLMWAVALISCISSTVISCQFCRNYYQFKRRFRSFIEEDKHNTTVDISTSGAINNIEIGNNNNHQTESPYINDNNYNNVPFSNLPTGESGIVISKPSSDINITSVNNYQSIPKVETPISEITHISYKETFVDDNDNPTTTPIDYPISRSLYSMKQ
ncbi:hypothetical protein ABK040_003361 [Willaertia magna]